MNIYEWGYYGDRNIYKMERKEVGANGNSIKIWKRLEWGIHLKNDEVEEASSWPGDQHIKKQHGIWFQLNIYITFVLYHCGIMLLYRERYKKKNKWCGHIKDKLNRNTAIYTGGHTMNWKIQDKRERCEGGMDQKTRLPRQKIKENMRTNA